MFTVSVCSLHAVCNMQYEIFAFEISVHSTRNLIYRSWMWIWIWIWMTRANYKLNRCSINSTIQNKTTENRGHNSMKWTRNIILEGQRQKGEIQPHLVFIFVVVVSTFQLENPSRKFQGSLKLQSLYNVFCISDRELKPVQFECARFVLDIQNAVQAGGKLNLCQCIT